MKTTAVPDKLTIRNVARQTISFQLPDLPAQEFRIAIPELISDVHGAIVPWGFASPEFEISDRCAELNIEVANAVNMQARVVFREDGIEARVRATNLSVGTWEVVNAFTCFACYRSDLFHDPEGIRTCVPTDDGWKPLSALCAGLDSGTPYTFVPIKGGPRLTDVWACRQLQARHAPAASRSEMCIVSADQQWVVGISTRSGAYLFNNRDLSCLHAAPFTETVAPGASWEAINTIFIVRGDPDDFLIDVPGPNCAASLSLYPV